MNTTNKCGHSFIYSLACFVVFSHILCIQQILWFQCKSNCKEKDKQRDGYGHEHRQYMQKKQSSNNHTYKILLYDKDAKMRRKQILSTLYNNKCNKMFKQVFFRGISSFALNFSVILHFNLLFFYSNASNSRMDYTFLSIAVIVVIH